MCIVSSGLSRFCSSSNWRRLLPLTSCITTAWRPLSSIVSWTATMFGMAQLGDGDGLAAEPLGDDRVGGERRLEHLDRDLARQRQVGAEPDLGHASLREATLQPVAVGEKCRRERRGAGRGRHVRSGTLVVDALRRATGQSRRVDSDACARSASRLGTRCRSCRGRCACRRPGRCRRRGSRRRSAARSMSTNWSTSSQSACSTARFSTSS